MRPQGQKIVYYIGTTIGILGGVIGMAVGIAASPIIGSIMSLFFIVVFGLAFGLPYLRSRKNSQLLATGRKANGKIVEMWDTGVTINNQPQIGMYIEVYPDSEPPFKAKVIKVISRLQTSFYQEGVSCIVKYDPNDKKTVAIESIGGSMDSSGSFGSFDNSYYPGKNQRQIEDEILAMDMEAKRLLTVGVECKAIVKSINSTNVMVNGSNPLYAIDLEIIPNDAPAYSASVKGLIMEASIPKYQPGCQIYVKYDPSDKNKVTLFHS